MQQNVTAFFKDTRIDWHPAHYYGNLLLPQQLRHWLTNPKSMTRQLRHISQQNFSVKVHAEGMQFPHFDERNVLHLSARSYTWVREVDLFVCGEAWLYGRAVIPTQSLAGAGGRLRYLSNRPLGDLLFRDPALKRSEFELARLIQEDTGKIFWARRSIFYYMNQPLLLTELFLPPMLEYIETNDHATQRTSH